MRALLARCRRRCGRGADLRPLRGFVPGQVTPGHLRRRSIRRFALRRASPEGADPAGRFLTTKPHSSWNKAALVAGFTEEASVPTPARRCSARPTGDRRRGSLCGLLPLNAVCAQIRSYLSRTAGFCGCFNLEFLMKNRPQDAAVQLFFWKSPAQKARFLRGTAKNSGYSVGRGPARREDADGEILSLAKDEEPAYPCGKDARFLHRTWKWTN